MRLRSYSKVGEFRSNTEYFVFLAFVGYLLNKPGRHRRTAHTPVHGGFFYFTVKPRNLTGKRSEVRTLSANESELLYGYSIKSVPAACSGSGVRVVRAVACRFPRHDNCGLGPSEYSPQLLPSQSHAHLHLDEGFTFSSASWATFSSASWARRSFPNPSSSRSQQRRRPRCPPTRNG